MGAVYSSDSDSVLNELCGDMLDDLPHEDVTEPSADDPNTVILHGGFITFYPHDGRFQATCPLALGAAPDSPHYMCRLTRYNNKSKRNPAKGRPLGHMTEWWRQCRNYSDRQEHISVFGFALLSEGRRAIGRKFFNSKTHGRHLLSMEAPSPDGESVLCEPCGFP